MSSCIGTKHLQENEKLLYRQTLKYPKGFSPEGLTDLYVEKVNSRIRPTSLSLPVGMYYLGKKKFKKEKFVAKKEKVELKFDRKIARTKSEKKIANLQYRKQNAVDAITKKMDNGNLLMQWGEPIAVFDTAAIRQSKIKIETFLFNKGYFDSKVESTYKDLRKKRVSVTYEIIPGKPFTFDTLFYNIHDSKVLSFILKNKANSFIKKGEQYDQNNLGKERDRIDQLLKDNGYYDFSKQYVDFSIDTTTKKNKIKIQLEILNPSKRGYHKQFKVDSIIFTPDAAVLGQENKKRQSTSFHDITFNSFENLYSKKILAQRVFISKDSLYSRTKTFNTQRQLANLDNFKFVNLNYDTSGGKFIANLFTSPLDRYTWEMKLV
ncbi:MAG: POTRA domain-containing protein [Cyclobacteriaceae bacterium]